MFGKPCDEEKPFTFNVFSKLLMRSLAFRPRGCIVGWLKHVPAVKKEKQSGNPRTLEQRRAVPTAGEIYNAARGSTTRGEEWNTVLQVRKPTTSGTTSDLINREAVSVRTENFRDEDESDQVKIETVWFRQSEMNV